MQPTLVGAVLPSSEALAELLTETAPVRQAGSVIEFGCGTGVITSRILRKLSEGAAFFAMEINPEFVRLTRRRCPTATVYQDTVLRAGYYLELNGLARCDVIVCSLPWALFSNALQDEILNTTKALLRPGGVFVSYAYLQGMLLPGGARFRRKLQRTFHCVTTTRVVWLNLPPAFVYKAVA